MSKRESLQRQLIIINKLRVAPRTFDELSGILDEESEIHSYNFRISKRTFQRDINEIRSLFFIDIRFDSSQKHYYIEMDEQSERQRRILEAFDTFNALNMSDRLSDFIHFEKRKPQGTENLYGLLHAIRNQLQIEFWHQKFWDVKPTERKVEPYALKEFSNRWYLLAKDLKDNSIKSFALDRMKYLEFTKMKFQRPAGFDVNEHYKHSFGIIGPNGQKPKEIILSFDPLKGKYIKSLPLHESQEIILDNESEVRIKLSLIISYDFIMEILSHGDEVKVIKPVSLIKTIKDIYQRALNRYQKIS
jgi:predicted DNA-binding transcriptional regulator YafY